MLVCFLAACGGQSIAIPTATHFSEVGSPASVPAQTLLPSTTTPTPESNTAILITPDAVQAAHWIEYEDALGAVLLPPNSSRGEVLCEWILLGRSDQRLYVWALCQSPPYAETLPPSVASMPAVIELDPNGLVQSVRVPGSGSAYASDINSLFPADIQDQIFAHSVNTAQMEAHINSRREHPGPPAIILSTTPIP